MIKLCVVIIQLCLFVLSNCDLFAFANKEDKVLNHNVLNVSSELQDRATKIIEEYKELCKEKLEDLVLACKDIYEFSSIKKAVKKSKFFKKEEERKKFLDELKILFFIRNFKGKTIAITGVSGTVGDKVLNGLRQFPDIFDLKLFFRHPDDHEYLKSYFFKDKIIKGDLRDFDSLKKIVEEGDVIYHLAALLPEKNASKHRVLLINVVSSMLLAAMAQKKQKRFVYTSTASVYRLGKVTKGFISEDFELKENVQNWLDHATDFFLKQKDDIILKNEIDYHVLSKGIDDFLRKHPMPKDIIKPETTNNYALSKLLAENLIMKIYPENSIILRLSSVYGAGDSKRKRFVARVLDKVEKSIEEGEKKVEIPTNRLCDIIAIRDVVAVLIKAGLISMDKVKGKNVITITGPPVTIKEIYDAVINEVPGTLKVSVKNEASDLGYKCDLSIMREVLGIDLHRMTSINEGIKQTVAWYRKIAGLNEETYRNLQGYLANEGLDSKGFCVDQVNRMLKEIGASS